MLIHLGHHRQWVTRLHNDLEFGLRICGVANSSLRRYRQLVKNDAALNATRLDGRHSEQGEGRGLNRLHGAFSLFLASFNLEAQKKRPRWIHPIRRSLLIITLPIAVQHPEPGLAQRLLRMPLQMPDRALPARSALHLIFQMLQQTQRTAGNQSASIRL